LTAVAIVSLALAIGVNTTVVGVARAVLLKPLPVGQPQELRLIYWRSDKGTGGVSQINSSGGAIAMFTVALASSVLPARRAARLDPLVALRRE
jgi:hypothetical protein